MPSPSGRNHRGSRTFISRLAHLLLFVALLQAPMLAAQPLGRQPLERQLARGRQGQRLLERQQHMPPPPPPRQDDLFPGLEEEEAAAASGVVLDTSPVDAAAPAMMFLQRLQQSQPSQRRQQKQQQQGMVREEGSSQNAAPMIMLGKRDPDANNNGMSLSILNNMDVLRSKLLRELIQRRENLSFINHQSWINRNQEILNSVG